MHYIWDNYDKDKYFSVINDGSPYIEVLNPKEARPEVNIVGRIYNLLFPPQLRQDEASEVTIGFYMEKYLEDLQYHDLANLLLHYQARLDRESGRNLLDFMADNLRELLLAGSYGTEAQSLFAGLNTAQQYEITTHLARYYVSGQRKSYYFIALQSVFTLGRETYYENETGIVHICLKEVRNEANEDLLELLEYLFKDIALKTNVMFKGEYCGIIGIASTMYLDEIGIV